MGPEIQNGINAGIQEMARSFPQRIMDFGWNLATGLLFPVALIAAPFLFTSWGERFTRGLLGENSELAETIFGFRDQLVAGAATTGWLSWLAPVFNFLGLDVDQIVNDQIDQRLAESFGSNPQLLAALRPIGRALAEAGFQNVNLNPQDDAQRAASEQALANSLFALMSNQSVTDAQLNTALEALTNGQGTSTVNPALVTGALTRLLQDETRRDALLNQRGALVQRLVQQYTGQDVTIEQIRAIASSGLDFGAAMNIAQRVRDQGLDAFVAAITTDTQAAANDRRTLLTLLRSADPAILPENVRGQATQITSLLTAIDTDPAVRTAAHQLASGGHLQTVISYAQGDTSLVDLAGQVGFGNLRALNTLRVAMGEQAVPEQSSAVVPPVAHPGIAAAVADAGLSPSISGGEEGSPATPAVPLATLAQSIGGAAQAVGGAIGQMFRN